MASDDSASGYTRVTDERVAGKSVIKRRWEEREMGVKVSRLERSKAWTDLESKKGDHRLA